MNQTASSHQKLLRVHRERSQDANLDCHQRLRPSRHCEKTPQNGGFTLHNSTDPQPGTFRKNTIGSTSYKY